MKKIAIDDTAIRKDDQAKSMHLVIFEEPNISLVIFSLKYPKAISLVGAINETLIDAIYHMRGNHLILVAYIFGESKRVPGIMLAD